MKKFLPDIFFVVGLVLVTTGVFILYIPAGIMAAGISSIVWSVLLAKGGDGQ